MDAIRFLSVTDSSYSANPSMSGYTRDVNLSFPLSTNTTLRPVLGGVTGGFHYGPDPSQGDIVVLTQGNGGWWYPTGYTLPVPLPTQTVSTYALNHGESAIIHTSGTVVHIRNDGSVVIKPGSGGLILLGGTAATEGVARIGDAVQVSVNGSAYSGTITAGSSLVKSL